MVHKTEMDIASQLAGHVVLVDDDPHLLHALRFAFEADGYGVTALESGEDLLEAQLGPDRVCIVIDERLRGLPGLDAMKQLRARGVAVPAILMTSHPSRDLMKRAAAAGIPIIEKPLLGDGLAKKVSEILGDA